MADTPQPQVPEPPRPIKNGVARCKRKRRDLVDNAWATSVDYARGKPFDVESDEDRVYVNVDNTMSKRKAAQIASQLPEARLKAKNDQVKPVLGAFAVKLNETLRAAGVGDAMFETSKDVINAAGIGVVICGYEARTESRVVPTVDPMTLSPDQQMGMEAAKQVDDAQAAELYSAYQIPTQVVPRVVSARFYADRVSPSDFLWPLEFERSNFDKAPWLGHSNKMRWADGKTAFKLTDDEKQAACGGTGKSENLRDETGEEANDDDDVISYDEIFYWHARFDANEKYLDAIWRIVYVDGIDRVPIHEPWNGQKFLKGGGYAGACKLPLRVLTLDYISDDPIPPSDSAVARPQTNEMIRSRTQMVQQRERSKPVRWHNVNLLDPLTSSNLSRGEWQASIPVKGDGSRVIGEVARANYPAEAWEFDRVIRGDLTEAWGIDSNQLGRFASGRRTKGEADIVQQNFATITGFQRGRVAAFFCGIAEVIAGLLAVHGEDLPLPPAAPPQPGQPPAPPMDVKQLSQQFDYWVLPDSTVMLDANQRADQLMDYIDMTGKSGFVNPAPIIEEITLLKGLDPAKVMMQPQPKPDEPPQLSYRFSGAQDLTNPIVLAMLMKEDKAPSPDELKAAIALLQAAGLPVSMLPPPPPTPDGAPAPAGPEMPPADARPGWTAMPSVTKRSE